MKQVFKAILFLPLFASLGIGAEYGLEEIPGMREAVDNFRKATTAMFRLHDMTERTPEQEQEFN